MRLCLESRPNRERSVTMTDHQCIPGKLRVMKTAAHYVGCSCQVCGAPYARMTDYMTKEQAEESLERIRKGDFEGVGLREYV